MAEEEDREAAEYEGTLERQLKKWKRATLILGVALAVSIVAVIPFLKGHMLHAYWNSFGKPILVTGMGLLIPVFYVGMTTYNLWWYLRAVRKTNRKYPPPESRYRKQNRERKP